MSFNTNTGRAEYTASTGQTLFPFVFKIFNNIDIKVYKTLANAVPNETNDLLILDIDYTVSIDGDAGGSITLLSAASINDAITLLRDLSTTREIEYQTSGDLLAETLNNDQEYQTYLLADNKQISDRTLIFEENLQGMDNKLPTPEALKILRWRADEKALENASIVDDGVFVNVFNVSTMEDILTTSYTTYSTVNIRGYHSENDGGGGLFNWNSSMNKSNANGGTIIDPSVSLANQGTGVGTGCWIRQNIGLIDPKWFGATGDGVTDDSISMNKALSVGDAKARKGVYLCHNLNISYDFDMDEGAILLFNGIDTDDLATLTTGQQKIGTFRAAGNNTPCKSLLRIDTDRNEIAIISTKDISSPLDSGTNYGITVGGDKNTIGAIYSRDLLNTGNVNDSVPQMIGIGGDDNTIQSISADNITSCVVTFSTGKNKIGDILIHNATDNGVYQLSGAIDIGNMVYHGNEEAVVTKGDLFIDSLIVRGSRSALGLQDCGNVRINTITVEPSGASYVSELIKTRTTSTVCGDVSIGSVNGVMKGGTLMNFDVGTVAFLSIENVKLKYLYDAGTTGSISSWLTMIGVLGFNFRSWDIKIVDTTDALSETFYFKLPTGITKKSYFYDIDIDIVNNDEVTESPSALLRISGLGNSLMHTKGVRLRADIGPYGREVKYGEVDTSSVAPAVGTWRVGQKFFNRSPSASGTIGWVCVTAGTPGIWKSFGVITA